MAPARKPTLDDLLAALRAAHPHHRGRGGLPSFPSRGDDGGREIFDPVKTGYGMGPRRPRRGGGLIRRFM